MWNRIIPEEAVTVTLSCGLGNQLFMAFAGLRLAKKLNLPLIFRLAPDLLRSPDSRARPYALALFPGNRVVAREMLWDRSFRYLGGHQVPQRVANLILRPKKRLIYREKKFSYEPRFEFIDNPVYLRGFFQSFRYLPLSSTEILRAFEHCEEFRGTKGDDNPHEDIVLHVRGNDFRSSYFKELFGLSWTDHRTYVQQALFCCGYDANSTLRVFTDDIQYTRQLLDGLQVSYVLDDSAFDPNLHPMHLLRRMSQTRFFIGSRGSTFSWWVAWLTSIIGGHSFFPSAWSNDEAWRASSIFLPEWHLLRI